MFTRNVYMTISLTLLPFAVYVLVQDFLTNQNIDATIISYDQNYLNLINLNRKENILISNINKIYMDNGTGRVPANENYSGVFWPPLRNPFTSIPTIFIKQNDGIEVAIPYDLLSKSDNLETLKSFLINHPEITQDSYTKQFAVEGLSFLLSAKFTFK